MVAAPASIPPSQTQLTAVNVLKDGEGVELKVNAPEVMVIGLYVWVSVVFPMDERDMVSIATTLALFYR